jgi:hypothetical protein
LAGQGLRQLCFTVIVGVVVVGCTSTGSSGSNAAPSGSGSPTATGTDTQSNVSASTHESRGPPVIALGRLKLASGTGPPGGSYGLSVPVQASAYGSATTVPFMVKDSTLKVGYSYDCSSTGGSRFVAKMISGSPGNPGSDHEGIVDESGASGEAYVIVNPHDTPGTYFLEVKSPCAWTIVVENR